eukprot:259747-Prorocentrum_minimum.AAC.2
MAGSARGGEKYESVEWDTAGGVRAVSDAGLPVLFVHGTHDKNVALQVAEFLYKVRSSARSRWPVQGISPRPHASVGHSEEYPLRHTEYRLSLPQYRKSSTTTNPIFS